MEQGLLKNAPPEQSFILQNGRVLKNLHELANALVSMDDQTFFHHVTKERNDFANWIAGVFSDEKLAKQISRLRSREAIRSRINDSLKESAKHFAAHMPKQEAVVEHKPAEAKTPKKKFLQSLMEKRQKIREEKEAARKAKEAEKAAQDAALTPEQRQLSHMEQQLSEILKREKEIEFKEKKLLEIEQKIEHKLLGPRDAQFFSREFVQGIVTGFLVTLILVLVYAKFVLQL